MPVVPLLEEIIPITFPSSFNLMVLLLPVAFMALLLILPVFIVPLFVKVELAPSFIVAPVPSV